MKALLCESYGPPANLQLRDVPDPVPGPKEVLLEVHACSVNFPDTLIIEGKYQVRPPLPFAPGSDVAGRVVATGEAVRRLKVGDEVVAFTRVGGFAEQLAVPETSCFPKPPQMSAPVAASFLMAYGTSYHALKDRAQLRAGETLLVLGASGGVGLAAVELGKTMGATVIAAASTAEKRALCTQHGADHTIDYLNEDLKQRTKELTNGRGADVVFDPVGDRFTEPAFRATARGGRHLILGFAAGDIPKLPLNLPLLKESSVVGVFWGNFVKNEPRRNQQNVVELLGLFNEGKIRPHIHATYPLARGIEALEELAGRRVMGKVVVVMNDAA